MARREEREHWACLSPLEGSSASPLPGCSAGRMYRSVALTTLVHRSDTTVPDTLSDRRRHSRRAGSAASQVGRASHVGPTPSWLASWTDPTGSQNGRGADPALPPCRKATPASHGARESPRQTRGSGLVPRRRSGAERDYPRGRAQGNPGGGGRRPDTGSSDRSAVTALHTGQRFRAASNRRSDVLPPPTWQAAAEEVWRVLETPVAELLATAGPHRGYRWDKDHRYQVPYFEVGGERVWGATAMILAELMTVIGASLENPWGRLDGEESET